ncbi:MAG: hypothetical protein IT181_13125 [Acidobacteria bacterium]|nr:hypothetical protein [Acidobacteriota bacterium]
MREYFADSFALSADAQGFINRLRLLSELRHLAGHDIVAVASQIEPRLHGYPCRAFVIQPKVQGPLSPMFGWALAQFCRPLLEGHSPDYLIVYDAGLWTSMTALQREALMYHELSHLHVKEDPETGAPKIGDDGRIVLQVVPHDTEVFHSEIERYGPVALELEQLVGALRTGTENARRKQRAAS